VEPEILTMGCGASKNDVIKTVISKDSKNGDSKMNGKGHTKSQESVNSESSTIPASDMYQNGNVGNNNEQAKASNGGLPPLKPPRTMKHGTDINNQSGTNNLSPVPPKRNLYKYF